MAQKDMSCPQCQRTNTERVNTWMESCSICEVPKPNLYVCSNCPGIKDKFYFRYCESCSHIATQKHSREPMNQIDHTHC